MLTVPLTRGSSRKLRPVIWPMAFTTASISALTKLSVTLSSLASAANAAAPTDRQSAAKSVRIRGIKTISGLHVVGEPQRQAAARALDADFVGGGRLHHDFQQVILAHDGLAVNFLDDITLPEPELAHQRGVHRIVEHDAAGGAGAEHGEYRDLPGIGKQRGKFAARYRELVACQGLHVHRLPGGELTRHHGA